MPYRNPGKKAFAAIISIAAAIGVIVYVLAGWATPEPGIETPAYEEGVPPPAGIMGSGSNDTAQNETTTASDD